MTPAARCPRLSKEAAVAARPLLVSLPAEPLSTTCKAFYHAALNIHRACYHAQDWVMFK